MNDKKEESSFAKATEDKEKKEQKPEGGLKQTIEECEKKASEYLAGWQRERADFLNYKKEEMERIGSLLSYAVEELILKILPILDNFEIIEKKLPEDLKKDENIKGLLLIKNQLLDFLRNQGVEEIESVGQGFNPNFHEIAEEVEPSFAKASEGKEIKSGIIVEEIQKGYKTNSHLLRPARVKVVR